MQFTPFAGLTRLDPGDPLSLDNYSFQDRNVSIIDTLLRIGAVTHRHDGHAQLVHVNVAPIDPIVTVDDVGGTIPSDTSVTIGYTLLDEDGGETELNENPIVVTTQEGLGEVSSAPFLEWDTAAGTLIVGSYAYGVTILDGTGGETAIGPPETVSIDPGSPTNQIIISGLSDIVTEVGGTGWRLWRSINGGGYNLVADGPQAQDAVTDDGTLCPDCNQAPPQRNVSTNATSRITVTIPLDDPTDIGHQPVPPAVAFRIYGSLDGTFSSPALLGEYDISEFDVAKAYTDLAFSEGSPPVVDTTQPGASQIDADTDIINLSWKGAVADQASLPAAGNTDGDVRLTLDEGKLWRWDTAIWVEIETGGGGGGVSSLANGEKITWLEDGHPLAELWAEALYTRTQSLDINFDVDDLATAWNADLGLIGSWTIAGGKMQAVAQGGILKKIHHDEPIAAGADFDMYAHITTEPNWNGDMYLGFTPSANTAKYISFRVGGTIAFETSAPENGGSPGVANDIGALNIAYDYGLSVHRRGDTYIGRFYRGDPETTDYETEVIYTLPADVADDYGQAADGFLHIASYSNSNLLHVDDVRLREYTVPETRNVKLRLKNNKGVWREVTVLNDDGTSDLLGRRANIIMPTGSPGLGPAASRDLTVKLGKAWSLLSVVTNWDARVRLYTTAAKRAADAGRAFGAAIPANSGCLLDIQTASLVPYHIAPGVKGFNLDAPVTTDIYARVTNIAAAGFVEFNTTFTRILEEI